MSGISSTAYSLNEVLATGANLGGLEAMDDASFQVTMEDPMNPLASQAVAGAGVLGGGGAADTVLMQTKAAALVDQIKSQLISLIQQLSQQASLQGISPTDLQAKVNALGASPATSTKPATPAATPPRAAAKTAAAKKRSSAAATKQPAAAAPDPKKKAAAKKPAASTRKPATTKKK